MKGGPRWPLLGVAAGALLLWWCWPALAPRLRAPSGALAVVVLAEDPRRTAAALEIWPRIPSAWLVPHAGPSLQRAVQAQLQARRLPPSTRERVRPLTCGLDTLGQLTCLAEALRRWRRSAGGPAIGSVLLVTGEEHLPRALAIAHIVLGAEGLAVTGCPARTQAAPEDPLRTQRDRLRAQLWRATGWDGHPPFLGQAP
ncbi:hypothetical protein FQK07_14535 [Synechococcus sp. BSF8S]|uniref:hypothetical protein n=1 Tax=Synechococcales TaxID=1890424 RepID=UPI001629FC96|nr:MULTISPECIES: hypothetical protein [unclassified Synechococcus]MBC1262443.1 hypothetical protein [Synechococcus sp. BSF8S]MBC1265401.1 hypothetical protein [Synechococcus sp. BSA11S]